MKALAFIVMAACIVAVVKAQPNGPTYAQYLTAQALAHHPEVLGLTMHVTPPGTANNIIIASNVAPLGKVTVLFTVQDWLLALLIIFKELASRAPVTVVPFPVIE